MVSLVNEQNRKTGRLLVDQMLVVAHWGGLETDKNFNELAQDVRDNICLQECEWRFIRPDSTTPTKAPRDAFEIGMIKEFIDGDATFNERTVSADNGKQYYQYYQPVYATAMCLVGCHNVPPGGAGIDMVGSGLAFGGGLASGTPLEAGDMMGVVQVTIPNGPTLKAISGNQAVLLTTAIITVFLAMVASYVIVRYVIVKPLKHLRDVSDAVSHGNTAIRAEIRTGDEFESLAVAFNRMLRHMVDAHDELRNVNKDLDAKVDQLAQANMQLYEMNRIKGDFMATMSHELRTPLNSILGFSDVLESIDTLDEKQKRYVKNIQKSGCMLLEMINNILDLAKIESGKMEVRLSDFRVEHVVDAQCDMARPLAEKKNIDLEIKIAPNLPMMHQDQSRVQQILNNLLSNAIKFTPEGGRIKVTAAHAEPDDLVLKVSDTGVGIAEEDQQVIFEKFRQSHSALVGGDAMTREHSGTGLGLSIVKELCKLLEGEISVESELGKGSTFIVRLPWNLQEQPKLNSPLLDGIEEFAKPQLEVQRLRKAEPASPEPQTTK